MRGVAIGLLAAIGVAPTRWLLLPVGRFHSVWQSIIGLLVLYTAVMTPITLCFDNVPASLPDGMVAFDVFTDVFTNVFTDVFTHCSTDGDTNNFRPR